MKTCTKCGDTEPSAVFKKGSARCRSCLKQKCREWYEANKEYARAYARRHQAERDPEEKRAYQRVYFAGYRAKKRAKREALKEHLPEGLRRCSKCQEIKVLKEFRSQGKDRKGWRSSCRDCDRTATRLWHAAHPEQWKKHRANNPARFREASQRWYKKFGKQTARKKRAEDPEYLKKQRDYAQARRKLYPELAREYARRRDARKKGNATEKVDLQKVLKTHGMVCHLCGKRIIKKELQFDHLIPIAKGGPHVEWNIAPAHKACNSRKRHYFITPAQLPLFS